MVVGSEFNPVPPRLGFTLRPGMREETHVQLRLAVLAGEFGTYLILRVVEQKFVVLLAMMLFRLDARERPVGGQAPNPAEPRVRLPPVMHHAGDIGPVDVPFEEAHQHFLSDPWNGLVSPTLTRRRGCGTYPARGIFIEVCTEPRMFLGPLPVELDFDAAKLVRINLLPFGAGDDGRLQPPRGWFGVRRVRVGRRQGQPAFSGADLDPIGRRRGSVFTLPFQMLGEALGQVIVGGKFQLAGHEFALPVIIETIKPGMAFQLEPLPGSEVAQVAFPMMPALHPVVHVLAQRGVAVQFLTIRGVVERLRVKIFQARLGGNVPDFPVPFFPTAVPERLIDAYALVVVARESRRARPDALRLRPDSEAVLRFGRIGPVKPHRALARLRQPPGIVEGNEPARCHIPGLVLPTVSNTFLEQQPLDKGQVRFPILDAVGTHRVLLRQAELQF